MNLIPDLFVINQRNCMQFKRMHVNKKIWMILIYMSFFVLFLSPWSPRKINKSVFVWPVIHCAGNERAKPSPTRHL